MRDASIYPTVLHRGIFQQQFASFRDHVRPMQRHEAFQLHFPFGNVLYIIWITTTLTQKVAKLVSVVDRVKPGPVASPLQKPLALDRRLLHRRLSPHYYVFLSNFVSNILNIHYCDRLNLEE